MQRMMLFTLLIIQINAAYDKSLFYTLVIIQINAAYDKSLFTLVIYTLNYSN